MPRFQLLIAVIEFAATLAFALSGFIEATCRKMDVVGVLAVAFITAFGGGTVRDILLDRRPFFWVEHPVHVWLIFGLSLLAVPWLRAHHHQFTARAILIPDALGLGLCTVTGVGLAHQAGMPVFVSAMMGVTRSRRRSSAHRVRSSSRLWSGIQYAGQGGEAFTGRR